MGCCLLVLCLALQLRIQVGALAVDGGFSWMLGSLKLCNCLLHCASCWKQSCSDSLRIAGVGLPCLSKPLPVLERGSQPLRGSHPGT